MTLLERLLAGLAAVLIVGVSVQSWRLHREQNAHHAAALTADTLTAHNDTSRTVVLSTRDSTKILGDSLGAQQRRVIQVVQRNDALDKALRQQRIAFDQLTAQVRALNVRVSSSASVTTDTATGTRAAHFDVDQTPYKGTADVSLPAHGTGSLALALSLPPAAIGLRMGCGATTDGLRSATATATGPKWLRLELGRVEQDPALCNPAAKTDNRSTFRKLLARVGISAGYGVTVVGTHVYTGPAITAGVKLWP